MRRDSKARPRQRVRRLLASAELGSASPRNTRPRVSGAEWADPQHGTLADHRLVLAIITSRGINCRT
jgi:hypothetical protein